MCDPIEELAAELKLWRCHCLSDVDDWADDYNGPLGTCDTCGLAHRVCAEDLADLLRAARRVVDAVVL